MAMTTNSAPAKFSWADVVKGSVEPSPPVALKPAARGEMRCHCQGEILIMCGHYGWIKTFDEIDYADLEKTAGRVYVHKRDVENGASLASGDVVSFYLYADDQGLGAECCQLQQPHAKTLDAGADEFVPAPSWNVGATEFVPSFANSAKDGLNMEAAEFVPSGFKFTSTDVPEFVPTCGAFNVAVPASNVNSINLAYWSDDESDDECSVMSSDVGKAGRDAALKSPRSSSEHDSISTGAWSDSEDETTALEGLDIPAGWRAPPGLSLPKGWRPPPGLKLVAVA